MQRKIWSTVALFSRAVNAVGVTFGEPLAGLIMFKWFSTTTAPCASMNDAGTSAATAYESAVEDALDALADGLDEALDIPALVADAGLRGSL